MASPQQRMSFSPRTPMPFLVRPTADTLRGGIWRGAALVSSRLDVVFGTNRRPIADFPVPVGESRYPSTFPDETLSATSRTRGTMGRAMLDWFVAMGAGAGGGAIVEGVALWGKLNAWREDRERVRTSGKDELPGLLDYIDVYPDTLVALTRVVIGAVAGVLLRDQLTGWMAAVVVGASGPALLRRFGTARSPATVQPVEEPSLAEGSGV
ncbi:hypothetical protein ACBR40_07615 [Nonomuraea sp. AD125B]|uniref:hypothetical protein n=1 Tax=Nonomuraea sp. AD125B TaxID=3242897 RepID=UPI0035270171